MSDMDVTEPGDIESKPSAERVEVKADSALRVNVAFHQNQVPLIGGIEIFNRLDRDLSDVTVEVQSVPAFLEPKRIKVDKIAGGGMQRIAPVAVFLRPALLLDLKERLRGEITIVASEGDNELARVVRACELLSANEWTGVTTAPELLAAFVRPNDPAIDVLLRQASEKLKRAGRASSIDGYRENKKSRVWEVAEAIWASICDEAVEYAVPPASFEVDGQKVRTPSAIMTRKLGTCLDLTLLLAACFEQAGFNPIVVIVKGHAFVGLWLADHEFAQAVVEEPQALRKRRDLEDLLFIEATLLTSRQRFKVAVEQGAKLIEEGSSRPFEAAIDIKRARMRQIKPLSLADDTQGMNPSVTVALPTEMDIGEAPVFMEEERAPVDPLTGLSRLERWKRKLLDLSLRNKLLNFKSGKGSISLFCPDPGVLEDKLAAGDKLKILPRAKVMEGNDPRNAELALRAEGQDAAVSYARQALVKGDIHSDLDADELDVRLTELFRSARASMEEGGSNSLHISLGFVRWSPTDKNSTVYRAPLILLPVSLERRTARSGFSLLRHDDDARVNPTLLQMLRQDFQVSMPEFEGAELPMDASGLDVRKIWTIARKHLLDARGFEVTEEVVLSTFSFTKYLMWKDLVERTETLKRNAVVAHLIDTPTDSFSDGGDMPEERRLDEEVRSGSLLMPLAADSSQTAAVLAASRGRNFVLFGPPGTGKSQTIANMIVNLLGEQKTVLFVSQKTTALEVVKKRLDELGLGEFCLEVHSAKAQKSSVLGQLQHAWEARSDSTAARWQEKAEELDQLMLTLNDLVRALHQRRRNGLTAYSALGKVIAGREWHPKLRLSFPSVDYHDEASMRRLRELCNRVRISLGTVGEPAVHPLRLIRQTEWSPGWRRELEEAISATQKSILEYRKSQTPVSEFLGGVNPGDLSGGSALLLLAAQALDPVARDSVEYLDADIGSLRRDLIDWLDCKTALDQASGSLQAEYREGVFSLDFGRLIEEWREAESSNFVVRGSRKKKVAGAILPFVLSDPPSNVGQELVSLMDVSLVRQRFLAQCDLMSGFGRLWRGSNTDPSLLMAALEWVEETRKRVLQCDQCGLDVDACVDGLVKSLESVSRDFSEGGEVHRMLGRLDESLRQLNGDIERLATLIGTSVELGVPLGNDWLRLVEASMASWVPALHRSQNWCSWQRESQAASAEGLQPLMSAIEDGEMSADEISFAFELSYARWWIERLIDLERPLREFIGSFHEEAISRFIKLDDEISKLSRSVVVHRLSEGIPPRNGFGNDAEWGTLSREISKRARHMPLRQLFGQMPRALTTLAPCMMMSPLSIAQFLPAEAKPFDVVIFDEASQIPVWDAVGAIARGAQVVVVGDPKQLPPTTFFDRTDSGSDDAAEIEDLESILDECLAANIPHKRLSWHYRSRHESLIAFSNERYYDGRLVTFPSPVTSDRAVHYVHVPGGAYERGGGRVNQKEALAVVADVVKRLRDPIFENDKRSLGIVTFNSEQQRLIENLLDQERRSKPDIEKFFGAEWAEPVFVKNLESVQGDERDVILFSVGYGPDAAGHVTQNYGPLNLDGGARRLNVAITRARSELVVFATLKPEQIDLSRAKGAGVRDFKHFLEFAQRGWKALVEASAPTGREEDSEFEREVRRALEGKGWSVHTQVGASSFRIDLGIVHPDAPGRYLAAVECDGATYHRSATARDRDKLREAVLRRLGWRVRRVWSTDWWNDSERALEELHTRLLADLEDQRDLDRVAEEQDLKSPEESRDVPLEEINTPDTNSEVAAEVKVSESRPELLQSSAELPSPSQKAIVTGTLQDAASPVAPIYSLVEYKASDLRGAGFVPEPALFYDASYREKLRDMISSVITAEGPIFDEVLVRRIARFHGFQRAGSQIRDLVLSLVDSRFPRDDEGGRRVYWPDGSSKALQFCRTCSPEVRDHNDAPDAELEVLARGILQSGLNRERVAAEMAVRLGLGRLRQATRDRFEAIVSRVVL